jgi:toxin ParE1/3/4
MKIIWSPLSLERIIEISKNISEDKPGASVKWVESAFNAVERLKNFPQSGRIVPEMNRNEIQEILLGNYRIIYRLEKESILILTVRHGKQLLSEEELVR